MLPGDFLEVAEDASLTLGIGSWALGSAARQAALWGLDRPGERPVTVCVNLSVRQCLTEDTIDAVSQAIERSGTPAENICLEFTEAAVMADPLRVGRVLRGLKELGVQMAIDDFGTGQSSLRLLEQLPVDVVKIDRSFTTGMAQSREEAAIVAAVIGARARLRAAHGRRGRRDARPGRPPARARLRRRPGPLLRAGAAADRADRA